MYGQGTSGTLNSGGGSSIVNGSQDASTTDPTSSRGGIPGGGGGSTEDDTDAAGMSGGWGAVRIIWGAGRSYPSTDTASNLNDIS